MHPLNVIRGSNNNMLYLDIKLKLILGSLLELKLILERLMIFSQFFYVFYFKD
jgi:hypothetical protein